MLVARTQQRSAEVQELLASGTEALSPAIRAICDGRAAAARTWWPVAVVYLGA